MAYNHDQNIFLVASISARYGKGKQNMKWNCLKSKSKIIASKLCKQDTSRKKTMQMVLFDP